jgi:hypothetical protein
LIAISSCIPEGKMKEKKERPTDRQEGRTEGIKEGMNERRNEKEKVFYIGLLPMEDYKTPRGI